MQSLPLTDSLMCILPNSPKTGETIEDNLQSQSTFRPQQDVQPEPLTVHVSMEQVDRIPSGIQPSAMFGLSQGRVSFGGPTFITHFKIRF